MKRLPRRFRRSMTKEIDFLYRYSPRVGVEALGKNEYQ